MTESAIVVHHQQQIEDLKAALEIVRVLRRDVLVDGVDFGIIPGTPKPSLYKPGAEKIARGLRIRPVLTTLKEIIDFEREFIMYRYQVDMIEIDTGKTISSAIGSANSYEEKYRWRWVTQYEAKALDYDIDNLVKKVAFASEPSYYLLKPDKWKIDHRRPVEYWQTLLDAYEAGTAELEERTGQYGPYKQVIIKDIQYRVPNPQVFDQLNTIDKMSQKRGFVSSVLQAANVSDFFTQDLEDLPDFSSSFNIVVEKPAEVPPAPKQPAQTTVEGEIVGDGDDKITQMPPPTEQPKPAAGDNVGGGDATRKKQSDQKRRMEFWTYDKEGQARDFLEYAVEQGLGEDKSEAWKYLAEHWVSGKLAKLTDIDEEFNAAKKIVDRLAAELKKQVGAPAESKWTDTDSAELELLIQSIWRKSKSAFEGAGNDGLPLEDLPNKPAAIQLCIQTAIAQGWAFHVNTVEYNNQKRLIFHLVDGIVAVDEQGRPMPIGAFGGRTQMKKWLGDAFCEANGIDDWETGSTNAVDVLVVTVERSTNAKDGKDYLNATDVKPLNPVASKDADPVDPTKDADIPF